MGTVYDFLNNTPDLSALKQAVDKLGADVPVDFKKTTISVTVFAPNNAAFDKLFKAVNQTTANGLNNWQSTKKLRSFVASHVINNAAVKVADLSAGKKRANLNGDDLNFGAGGTVGLGTTLAKITQRDQPVGPKVGGPPQSYINIIDTLFPPV